MAEGVQWRRDTKHQYLGYPDHTGDFGNITVIDLLQAGKTNKRIRG
jgi:hypothetical protein